MNSRMSSRSLSAGEISRTWKLLLGTQPLLERAHDLRQRPAALTGRQPSLCGGELAVQLELRLEASVGGDRHHDHVAFAVLGDEDRLRLFMHEARDLVGVVA